MYSLWSVAKCHRSPYTGGLYTTNSNSYEGYFVCVYDIVAVLGNDHNDPVTDWEGI